MKGNFTLVFALIQAFNALVLFSLLVYYPIVYGNMVFTNESLKPINIPYYNPDLSTKTSDIYGMEWGFTFLDILRIIPPVFLNFTLLFALVKRSDAMGTIYLVTSLVLMAGEMINLGRRSYNWWHCGNTQFCRNLNVDGDPSEPNSVFLMAVSYNFAFVVIDLIYAVITYAINDPESLYDIEYIMLSKNK